MAEFGSVYTDNIVPVRDISRLENAQILLYDNGTVISFNLKQFIEMLKNV